MTPLFLVLLFISIALCGILFLPAIKARKSGNNISLLQPALLSGIILIGSFTLYAFIGSPKILPKLAEYDSFKEETLIVIRGINEAIKKSPDNPKIYADLGDAYSSIQNFKEAKEAYKAAVLLSNGAPEYILSLGRTEMALAGGEVNEEARKAFEMVLLQDKNNLMARYYVAIGKKQAGNHPQARKDFENLLKDLPEGIPLRSAIEREMRE